MYISILTGGSHAQHSYIPAVDLRLSCYLSASISLTTFSAPFCVAYCLLPRCQGEGAPQASWWSAAPEGPGAATQGTGTLRAHIPAGSAAGEPGPVDPHDWVTLV